MSVWLVRCHLRPFIRVLVPWYPLVGLRVGRTPAEFDRNPQPFPEDGCGVLPRLGGVSLARPGSSKPILGIAAWASAWMVMCSWARGWSAAVSSARAMAGHSALWGFQQCVTCVPGDNVTDCARVRPVAIREDGQSSDTWRNGLRSLPPLRALSAPFFFFKVGNRDGLSFRRLWREIAPLYSTRGRHKAFELFFLFFFFSALDFGGVQIWQGIGSDCYTAKANQVKVCRAT